MGEHLTFNQGVAGSSPAASTSINSKENTIMIIEIHAGEGGQDAAIFATELADIYSRQLSAAG